eukprot:9317293-Alexandrium_andersonii.AAC.1
MGTRCPAHAKARAAACSPPRRGSQSRGRLVPEGQALGGSGRRVQRRPRQARSVAPFRWAFGIVLWWLLAAAGTRREGAGQPALDVLD